MKSRELRAQAVIEFLKRCEANGDAPNLEEIARGAGMKYPSDARRILLRLIESGAVLRGKGARSYRLADATRKTIEVVGKVAAGRPMAAADAPIGELDLPALFPPEKVKSVVVQGRSMIGDHIEDGDTILYRETPTAVSGEKVIAEVDGGFTLKVYREFRSGPKKGKWLYPRNDELTPIRLTPEMDVRIIGVVTGIVRKY
jgi:SOS-response transcriptional repressor LexA